MSLGMVTFGEVSAASAASFGTESLPDKNVDRFVAAQLGNQRRGRDPDGRLDHHLAYGDDRFYPEFNCTCESNGLSSTAALGESGRKYIVQRLDGRQFRVLFGYRNGQYTNVLIIGERNAFRAGLQVDRIREDV